MNTLMTGLLFARLLALTGHVSDGSKPMGSASQLFGQLLCDQADLETEVRDLSNGKRIRAYRLTSYESEKSGCGLTLRYLTGKDIYDGKELISEVEEIWGGFRQEAETMGARIVSLWADSDRLATGIFFSLERGIDGRWRKRVGFPPENYAVSSAGEDCCVSCATEHPSLGDAALWGDTAKLRELIEAGEDFDKKDNVGATPLIYALLRGKSEAARLLIAAGADPNTAELAASPFPAFTALSIPAAQGDLETVNRLIGAGADVNGRTADGATALAAAAERGRVQVVRYLVSHGASIDASSHAGVTPLMLACREGRGVLVRELLALGADPGLVDREGRTGLNYAVQGRQSWHEQAASGADCRLEIVYALLSVGADPNSQDREGRTAITVATDAEDNELIELLGAFQRPKGLN